MSPAPRSAPASVKCRLRKGCARPSRSMNGSSAAEHRAVRVKLSASGRRSAANSANSDQRDEQRQAGRAPARARGQARIARAERLADERGRRDRDPRRPRSTRTRAGEPRWCRPRSRRGRSPTAPRSRSGWRCSGTAARRRRSTRRAASRARASRAGRSRRARCARTPTSRTPLRVVSATNRASPTHLRGQGREPRALELEAREAEAAEDQERVQAELHRGHDRGDQQRDGRVARGAEGALDREREREEQRRAQA